MTRADAVAAAFCLAFWAAVIPAFFHHFLPLACWLSGWLVLVVTKPEKSR